ncbi:hypothetical protein [Streptomyces lydicus]|uniref:hypothetical protein n=1 Tax=Streptomyces lydicus TaxID=47763 RepID=UPI00379C1DE1
MVAEHPPAGVGGPVDVFEGDAEQVEQDGERIAGGEAGHEVDLRAVGGEFGE